MCNTQIMKIEKNYVCFYVCIIYTHNIYTHIYIMYTFYM